MKKQQGFAIIQLLLGLVIVAAISGVGWYVYRASDAADDVNGNAQQASTSSVIEDKTPDETATSPVNEALFVAEKQPDGTYLVTSELYGFQFSYPEKFGELTQNTIEQNEFTRSDEYPYEISYTTANSFSYDNPYAEGVIGEVSIELYKKGVPIPTRKYGSLVELKDGKWIIAEVNISDIPENKLGSEYRDFNKETVAATDIHGIPIYTFKSGDEGVSNDLLTFEINGRLFTIKPAAYTDGQYSSDQPEPNDPAPYAVLVNQVKSSIKKL